MKIPYRFIFLKSGETTKISNCDYDAVIQHGWSKSYRSDRSKGYGYACTSFGKKFYKMHRFILGVTDSNVFVDHINRDTFDNRRENLRLVSREVNAQNRKLHSNNKLKATGVIYRKDRGKYLAYIGIKSKPVYLGYFDSIDEAMAARKAAELKYR
jgi:hypothetical protein